MPNNYWFMLALVAFFFAFANFVNVRTRKRQEEASASDEPAEVAQADPPPRRGMHIKTAATPEILSRRRHNKGW